MQGTSGQLWDFDEIAYVEPARAEHLKAAPSPGQIAALAVQKFEVAFARCAVQVGWAEARDRPPDARVVVQFEIGCGLYDWLFNACTGYRAQFRLDPELGWEYNRELIDAFRGVLAARLPKTIKARRLDGDFNDLGTIDISLKQVLQSLDPDLSKLWCCGRLLLGDGQVRDLIPSASGPRLRIDAATTWPAFAMPDPDAWLEVNGAFLGPDGPYQFKSPTLRGQTLSATGMA